MIHHASCSDQVERGTGHRDVVSVLCLAQSLQLWVSMADQTTELHYQALAPESIFPTVYKR